ncbi:MAG: CxxC-x17-CxxC domain-containing protein [Bacteroidota bacterium]
MFRVTCATCGVETTVPFEPVAGKPVYCRACFQPKPRA